jgi:hypothetical protein
LNVDGRPAFGVLTFALALALALALAALALTLAALTLTLTLALTALAVTAATIAFAVAATVAVATVAFAFATVIGHRRRGSASTPGFVFVVFNGRAPLDAATVTRLRVAGDQQAKVEILVEFVDAPRRGEEEKKSARSDDSESAIHVGCMRGVFGNFYKTRLGGRSRQNPGTQ